MKPCWTCIMFSPGCSTRVYMKDTNQPPLTCGGVLRCRPILYILLTGKAWEGIAVFVSAEKRKSGEKWGGQVWNCSYSNSAHAPKSASVLKPQISEKICKYCKCSKDLRRKEKKITWIVSRLHKTDYLFNSCEKHPEPEPDWFTTFHSGLSACNQTVPPSQLRRKWADAQLLQVQSFRHAMFLFSTAEHLF